MSGIAREKFEAELNWDAWSNKMAEILKITFDKRT
jgi:hypothetical protein